MGDDLPQKITKMALEDNLPDELDLTSEMEWGVELDGGGNEHPAQVSGPNLTGGDISSQTQGVLQDPSPPGSQPNQFQQQRQSQPDTSQQQTQLPLDRKRQCQQQFMLLLHANKCNRRKVENLNNTECKVTYCQTMIDVIGHMKDCKVIKDCPFKHCSSSRQMILHYKFCIRPDCQFCMPFRLKTD